MSLNKIDFVLIVTNKKRNEGFIRSISSNRKIMIFLDYLIYKKLIKRVFTFKTGDINNNNAFIYISNVQIRTIRKHLQAYRFMVDSDRPTLFLE